MKVEITTLTELNDEELDLVTGGDAIAIFSGNVQAQGPNFARTEGSVNVFAAEFPAGTNPRHLSNIAFSFSARAT